MISRGSRQSSQVLNRFKKNRMSEYFINARAHEKLSRAIPHTAPFLVAPVWLIPSLVCNSYAQLSCTICLMEMLPDFSVGEIMIQLFSLPTRSFLRTHPSCDNILAFSRSGSQHNYVIGVRSGASFILTELITSINHHKCAP